MDINKLIDAARAAAVGREDAPSNNPRTNTRLMAALHDARKTLAAYGINNLRLAAAISLAKLESRTQNGTATPAIQNEINILKEFLHA